MDIDLEIEDLPNKECILAFFELAPLDLPKMIR